MAIVAAKDKARISLHYPNPKVNRPFSLSALFPGCSDEDAFMTASGINAVQAVKADFVLKTVESVLTSE